MFRRRCGSYLIHSIFVSVLYFPFSELTPYRRQREKANAIKTINNGSMLVWQHVNFHGEYDFTQDADQPNLLFDLEKILALTIG